MRRLPLLICTVACILVWSAAAYGLPIHLRAGEFDPMIRTKVVAPGLQAKTPGPGVPSYFLMQLKDKPHKTDWKALGSLGVELLGYIPENTYIVRMTAEAKSKAGKLNSVAWIGPFHPAYRISPNVLSEAEKNAAGTSKVRILLFPGVDSSAVATKVKSLGGKLIQEARRKREGILLAEIPNGKLPGLARIEGVSWIEFDTPVKLFNDVAKEVMGVETVQSIAGLFGAGQTVSVCDTGLDLGVNDASMNADFRGRIKATYAYARDITNDWSDPHGHGTHVAGSVLGSGVLSGSDPSARQYDGSFAGMAPEADLLFLSIMDESGGLSVPDPVSDLFAWSYSNGARIQSNSWGSSEYAYTIDSQSADEFIWDHPDMTIVFAAGNDGTDRDPDGIIDPGSIGDEAQSKNIITVGASENDRATTGRQATYAIWEFPYPMSEDPLSDNPNGMAAFSSRGPATDGRIKPDICAPGTNVVSDRSSVSDSEFWGIHETNPNYLYCGGTSMATPLVSGASALIRQYYQERYEHSASAALVKATIINSADDMSPGQYGTGQYLEIPTKPNSVEGWGRLNVLNLMSPAEGAVVRYVDIPEASGFTSSGNSPHQYTYYVNDSSVPLQITLAWSDLPAALNSSKHLVDDLNLVVIGPDGTRLGNDTQGLGVADDKNNVEQVSIPGPVVGPYIIEVVPEYIAASIETGVEHPQGYALVTSGPIDTVTPDFCLSVWPSEVVLSPGASKTIPVTVTGFEGFNSNVTLSLPDLPEGVTAMFAANPVTPGVATQLTLSAATDASTSIDTTVAVQGTDGLEVRSKDVHLSVVAPDYTLALSPVSGKTWLGQTIELTVGVNASCALPPVTLSITGMPSDWVVTLPDPLGPGESGTVSIQVPVTAASGVQSFCIHGITPQGCARYVDGTLDIQPYVPFVVLTPNSMSGVALADMDGDGSDETIVGSSNGRLHVYKADCTELAGWPVRPGGLVKYVPAIGDIDDCGQPEIVAVSAGRVFAFKANGALISGWPTSTEDVITSPALADIDDDGKLEIFAGAITMQVYAYNDDGTAVPGWPQSTRDPVYGTPALGDIDDDGGIEVVAGDTTGCLWAWEADGTPLSTWPEMPEGGLGLGAITSSPALADLNNDDKLEIAITTHNYGYLQPSYMAVLDRNGQFLSGWPYPWSRSTQSSPAIGDVDGNGVPDIVVVTDDGCLLSMTPENDLTPGWPAPVPCLGGDNDTCLNGDLEIPMDYSFRASSPVLADIDGDGAVEIIVGSYDGKVHAFNNDGTVVTGWPKEVGGPVRTAPAVGNIDGDGSWDVMVTSEESCVYRWEAGGDTAYKPADLFPWPAFHGDSHATGTLRVLGLDSFTRADDYVWGVADYGGTWSHLNFVTGNPWTEPAIYVNGQGCVEPGLGGMPAGVCLLAQKATDMDVTSKMEFADAGGAFALIARASSHNTFYAATVDSCYEFRLERYQNGVRTVLQTGSMDGGYQSMVRIRVEGDTIKAKHWAVGTAEPATWNLVATDPSPLPAGRAGTWISDVMMVYSYDDFHAERLLR